MWFLKVLRDSWSESGNSNWNHNAATNLGNNARALLRLQSKINKFTNKNPIITKRHLSNMLLENRSTHKTLLRKLESIYQNTNQKWFLKNYSFSFMSRKKETYRPIMKGHQTIHIFYCSVDMGPTLRWEEGYAIN